MLKKTTYILLALIFLASCGSTFDSVKRGLTGAKKDTADEFLVKKKDPLILPPDFDSLPSPSDREDAVEEMSSFQKTLKKSSTTEITSSSGSSAEDSILKQIKKK